MNQKNQKPDYWCGYNSVHYLHVGTNTEEKLKRKNKKKVPKKMYT